MISLEGKKAFITGGSRGIGRATAILFARAGADVALNFHTRTDAAGEVRAAVKRAGRECLIVQADLSRRDDIDRMVEEVIHSWPDLDILVNNAGIWTHGEIGMMDDQVWTETMRINLDGVFRTTNLVVPHMKGQKKGLIILITPPVKGRSSPSPNPWLWSWPLTTSGSTAWLLAGWTLRCAPGFSVILNSGKRWSAASL